MKKIKKKKKKQAGIPPVPHHADDPFFSMVSRMMRPAIRKVNETLRRKSGELFAKFCNSVYVKCYGFGKQPSQEAELELRNKICTLCMIAWNIASASDSLEEARGEARRVHLDELKPHENAAVQGMLAEFIRLKWQYCRDDIDCLEHASVFVGPTGDFCVEIVWPEDESEEQHLESPES